MFNSSNFLEIINDIWDVIKPLFEIFKEFALLILSLFGIFTYIKNRSKIRWYANSDSKNPVILRITNMTNRKLNILGLFYIKDFILDKKYRKEEEMIVNEVQSSMNKLFHKESYNIIKKRNNIEGQCFTDPSLENLQLDSDSSKSFVLKNDILNEKIRNIFLKDSTGGEWDMPAKTFKEIKKFLLKDKIIISAKIVNCDNTPVKNTQLYIFEVVNNKPEVQFGEYDDVLPNVWKGSASTNKKGNINYYPFKGSLKKECKYTIGNGREFLVRRKLFSKEKRLFIFNIDKDSTKKEIKFGKVKLEQIENKENKK